MMGAHNDPAGRAGLSALPYIRELGRNIASLIIPIVEIPKAVVESESMRIATVGGKCAVVRELIP
jgi:hypothetical protein